MIDYVSIGKRIKLMRIKKGVLQKDLAAKIGISKPHMSNIETAHTKIGLETLIAISNVLGTSVETFLSDEVANKEISMTKDLEDIVNEASMDELRLICKVAKIVLKKE